MHISGYGPIDGYQADLSSARGEIQGQTALAVMSTMLLQAHNNNNTAVTFQGKNLGVQRKCQSMAGYRIRDHRKLNQDLYMEYHSA